MKRKIEAQLEAWKNMKIGRRPLLLNGARQVGKTWLLKELGTKQYENYIHVSLDINRRVASYFDVDISPAYIIKMLEAEFQQRIQPEKTLVILDEIQTCERALSSLKYFAEDAPEYHVVAAGSLLGVAVNREQFSFPVGKVQTHMLYPLTFEEFLWAMSDEQLASDIRSSFASMKPLPEGLHLWAIDRLREYLAVGGMPACVDAYAQGIAIIDLPSMQSEIINNYVADMAKYASPSEAVRIRASYNSLPAQLGKENRKFQYKVVQKGGTASIFGIAIEWLASAGVVLKSQRIKQGTQPVATSVDLSSFKLYMADIGLLCVKAGVRLSDVLSGMPHHFQGALAENYVAEQLAAMGHELFYWTSENTAEVDFVLQTQEGISALEVKSGTNTHSRSLSLFVKRYRPERAIRLSLKPFGSGGSIMAVPLYAVFCL